MFFAFIIYSIKYPDRSTGSVSQLKFQVLKLFFENIILGPKGNRRTEERLPQHFSIHRHGNGDSAVNEPTCLRTLLSFRINLTIDYLKDLYSLSPPPPNKANEIYLKRVKTSWTILPRIAKRYNVQQSGFFFI